MCFALSPREVVYSYSIPMPVDIAAELYGKAAHDKSPPLVWVEGAIIVGAGPAGLATSVCLQQQGISSLILEKTDCIASLWRYGTYDRLRLHIAKQFCELPFMGYPPSYPTYPTRLEFLDYVDEYAGRFDIKPCFNHTVVSATYDAVSGFWSVRTITTPKEGRVGEIEEETCFVSRWLVIATGENAQPVIPSLRNIHKYTGEVIHSSQYRNGESMTGKRVLVVGSGNSGMEVSLDLANHGALPSIVVSSPVHVLPRDILGQSTFAVSMWLMKRLSVQWTDRLLLWYSRIVLGDTACRGLPRPKMGPLELKQTTGKTPLLDVGSLALIDSGHIKVMPAISSFSRSGCSFTDGRYEDFDAVILATGYRTNVTSWLKDDELFAGESDMPNRWKGSRGLYAAGFSRQGLMGVSIDAQRIAEDISQSFHSGHDRFSPLSVKEAS